MGIEIKVLATPSPYRILLHVWLPLPMQDREVITEAFLVDLMKEQGGFLFVARSFDADSDASGLYPNIEIPPARFARVRMEVKLFGSFLKPFGLGPRFGASAARNYGDGISLSAVSNVDMKMTAAPSSLMNCMTRKIFWTMLCKMVWTMCKVVRKKGASWPIPAGVTSFRPPCPTACHTGRVNSRRVSPLAGREVMSTTGDKQPSLKLVLRGIPLVVLELRD